MSLSYLDGSKTLIVAALGVIPFQYVLPQVITFLEKNRFSSIAHLFIIQVRSKTLKHLDFFRNRRGLVGQISALKETSIGRNHPIKSGSNFRMLKGLQKMV